MSKLTKLTMSRINVNAGRPVDIAVQQDENCYSVAVNFGGRPLTLDPDQARDFGRALGWLADDELSHSDLAPLDLQAIRSDEGVILRSIANHAVIRSLSCEEARIVESKLVRAATQASLRNLQAKGLVVQRGGRWFATRYLT